MKTTKTLIGLLLLVMAGVFNNRASDGIWIYASYGPNDKATATFTDYRKKGISFLRGGANPEAVMNNPKDYALVTNLRVNMLMASDHTPLWDGIINPPANDDQLGSRLLFPLRVVSGTAFNLSNLKIVISSSDGNSQMPPGSLGYTPVLNNYSEALVGLWYGPDDVKGTADDETRVNGNGNQLVNELYYIGPGVAYAVESQGDANLVRNYLDGLPAPFAVTVTVSVTDGTRTIIPAVIRKVGIQGVRGKLNVTGQTISVASSGYFFFLEKSPNLADWSLANTVTLSGGDPVIIGQSESQFFRLVQR